MYDGEIFENKNTVNLVTDTTYKPLWKYVSYLEIYALNYNSFSIRQCKLDNNMHEMIKICS